MNHTYRTGTPTSRFRLERRFRQLLTTQLDSFEKLEIVRVLRASGSAMSAEALEAECRFSSDAVREALVDLEGGGIVEPPGGDLLVRLGPCARAGDVAELMRLYESEQSSVLLVVSTLAMERIRTMAVQVFGDVLIRPRRTDDDD